MATADTARLVASLELQDKFSKTADKALTKVDRIDKRLGAFSGAVNRNLARGVDAAVSRGIRALTGSVTEGLESLAELETATTRVDGAIAATGKTGEVTSQQIAAWANEIETATQAAFDDKAITAATGDLIRYGKVTTKNIKPAMIVMTDLAARAGDVEGASKQLAKALADPTKASGALRKAGVILTKQQQKQIDAMVEAGDVAGAQRRLLDELAKTTGGAAANSVGKYGDTLHLMADASEDAKRALAEGFFPVVQRVAAKITELANDPATLQRLRDFGNTLASAFDKAIDIAEDVDWKSMGDGLKVAYDWTSKLFGAFMAAPAEVKGLIIGLAGLSKLTGGAPIKFALDLGKDALGGVFGHFFDRGTPANPMFVVGKGIGGTGVDPASPATGIKDILKFGIVAAVPVAVAAAGGIISKEIGSALATAIAGGNEKLRGYLETGFGTVAGAMNPIGTFAANLDQNLDNLQHLDRIPDEIGRIVDFVTGKNQPGNVPTGDVHEENRKKSDQVKAAIIAAKTDTIAEQIATKNALASKSDALKGAVTLGASGTTNAARGAGNQVTGSVNSAASRIAAAVYGAQDTILVNNNINVSAYNVTTAQTSVERVSQNSSRTNDERHYG